MPSTYTPIATTTLSSASNVTFSSIPGTYTDLVLASSAKSSTSTVTPRIQFNSDTGSNYSCTYFIGYSGGPLANRFTNDTSIPVANFAGNYTEFSPMIISILNYSNTTTYKTLLSRGANTVSSSDVSAVVGLWRNTNAITSITLQMSSGSFAIGSTFTLYGIKAA